MLTKNMSLTTSSSTEQNKLTHFYSVLLSEQSPPEQGVHHRCVFHCTAVKPCKAWNEALKPDHSLCHPQSVLK